MAVIEAISTTYLEADAASVTFTSIPATYEHLQVRFTIRGMRTNSTNTTEVRLNGDTGNNYSGHVLYGSGSSAYAFGVASHGYLGYSSVLYTPAGTLPASSFASCVLDILDYANTNKNTTAVFNWGVDLGSYGNATFMSSVWDNTAAVNAISFTINPTYDTARGSEFTLYGLNSS
jgi:hypothetical protein